MLLPGYTHVTPILLPNFGYFHKSRLLYGLPAFVDQKSSINRVDKIIQKLLRLPERTNSVRLKIVLGIPDLCVYLCLFKIKTIKIKN